MENMTYEQALVIAAKNGNKKSFEELYKKYYQKVYALARTTLKNDADAEDVLQQTFINAWQNISKLDDVTAFNTWIQRITLNQCYSLLRQRKENISIDFTEDDEDTEPIQLESDIMLPEVYAEQADLKVRLGRIIDDLSDVQRQTIMLFYFDQFSVEEIAKIMDCSENTVKSRLFLARKAIKTEIEEQERKTGTKFYGIVGIPLLPFAKLFVEQVKNASISESVADSLLPSITGQTASAAVNTAVNAETTVTKIIASESTKTAAKYSLKSLGKTIATKVVAGLVAIGMISGGAAGTVYQVNAVESFDLSAISENKSYDTSENTEKSNTQAYSAYLNLLIESKQEIDSYTWQRGYFGNKELTKENASHPVVFCDIYGDETPEMIYIMANEFGGYQSASLNIVTYENDQVKSLYFIEYWDSLFAGGFYYYLYQIKGDKTLYAFESTGDDWWSYSYHEFEIIGDTLTLTNLYEYIRKPDYEHISATGPETIKEYTRSGTISISETEYNTAVETIESKTSSVLMYNYNCSDYALNYVAENGCPAMTCDEAIAYLREQIGLPSKDDDSSLIFDNWANAYKSFVLDKDFLNSGDRLLGYGDLETGFTTVSFALHDMNADEIPELIIFNGFNGRDIRSNYVFTFTNGQVVYCGNTSADVYIVDSYPGLFSGVTQTGWYLDDEYSGKYSEVTILDYLSLENNTVVKERVSVTGLPISSSNRVSVFETKNKELLDGSKKDQGFYRALTWRELQESGWDNFVALYYGSDNSVRARIIKFNDVTNVDLNWGWDLFNKDASEYDHNLAMAGLILSQAAESSENDIKWRLIALGFDIKTIETINYGNAFNTYYPAAAFGAKKVYMGGQEKLIVAVCVKGSTTIGDVLTDVEAAFDGFFVSATTIQEKFDAYVRKIKSYFNMSLLPENTILFITGHSLGGAVSGVLSKTLSAYANQNNRFVYTFASPNYETFEYDTDSYTNVHNIINTHDRIPDVPWGYERYGHDWYYDSWDAFDEQQKVYGGYWEYAKDKAFNVFYEHLLTTYLACLLNSTPKNIGEGASNPYSLSSIHCPVDITIVNADGKRVAYTKDSEVFYDGEPEVLIIIRDDEKFVVAQPDYEYEILFEVTGSGTMTYTQQLVNGFTDEIIAEKEFVDVSLKKGTFYGTRVISNDKVDNSLFEIDSKGKAINSISKDGGATKVMFSSDVIGWLSVVIAAIGIVVLVVDIFGIIRIMKKRKNK